ncbi:methyltransferase domain-containing protein [Streptomyces varsoviensis]|uniref:Protein-L-isoaspartate O-methyltransferase n=1 Tax=Streptomyces varsoviensis TaxID=67373 RepID=A0ABR5IRI2_9ACTN|nr:methyltransferase domain-containing protein [Streptomyces varsoviensis]KOG46199.1 protein-L-isoaspartate(D-aspartate) O-methyltransferase [Streptomyces varsoviensis]
MSRYEKQDGRDAGTTSTDWASVAAAVPRGGFLPEGMWPFDMETRRSVYANRADDPAAWQRYADADVPIVTQWDDGKHEGTKPGRVGTSSVSMPSVVFRMLGDLQLDAGSRVLEIGTGSGWTAALMAHRVGDRNVTSIEVDEAVADEARRALARHGRAVEVITGDGCAGHPRGAPYDRVIATVGVRTLPWAWVEQARPGGVIAAPWGTHYSHQDAIARLTVSRDGRQAAGPFTGPVEFMKLRGRRLPFEGHAPYAAGMAEGSTSSSSVTETEFRRGRFGAPEFAVGLRVPDIVRRAGEKRNGGLPVWFYSLSDRSVACAMFRGGQETKVWQAGPRRLWDEVEAAYRWWGGRGEPDHTRFGLTVTADATRAWLDDPAESWLL